jgi:hypothetical protein
MTLCRMTSMDFLCTNCISRGILLLHVLFCVTLIVYLTLGQPRGEVTLLHDDLAVSFSCSFAHFNLLDLLVIYCIIGGGCFKGILCVGEGRRH